MKHIQRELLLVRIIPELLGGLSNRGFIILVLKVLSSCTGTQEPIQKTRQYITANQKYNGYSLVHRYTKTQPVLNRVLSLCDLVCNSFVKYGYTFSPRDSLGTYTSSDILLTGKCLKKTLCVMTSSDAFRLQKCIVGV